MLRLCHRSACSGMKVKHCDEKEGEACVNRDGWKDAGCSFAPHPHRRMGNCGCSKLNCERAVLSDHSDEGGSA